MNYLKIKLKSGQMAYALREYFPYTDKPFFKSLDDILTDESLQVSLAHLFVQLYRDELVFLYENMTEHKYIVPIKHESKKFSEINNIICRNVAKIMGIEVLNDYFDIIKISRVDIRDDYTKDEHNIEIAIRKKYIDIPVIIFDCCCSTGIIFNKLSTEKNNNNLYITYGIRFNSNNIENTYVTDINNNEFDDDNFDTKKPGFFVRIYDLFGEKNVEVDFRDKISILIGENGFGKSTAIRLGFLALKAYCEIFDEIEINNIEQYDEIINYRKKDILSILASFNFKKIEIYYSDYFYEIKELEDINNNNTFTPHLNERVYSKFFGKGTIVNIIENFCEIIFDAIPEQIKKIASYALEPLDENGNIIATKSKHKVSFIDKNGKLFHEQYILNDKYLDLDFFKKHNILIDENNIEIMNNKKICKRDIFGAWNMAVDNLTIKVNDFCFNYDFVKKYGIFSNSCVYTIEYNETIPTTEDFSDCNEEVSFFLSKINQIEYQNIIRKVILEDRTIEIDYKDLKMKYQLKIDFNNINNAIRKKISKDQYNKEIYYEEINESLYKLFNFNSIKFFDCTKSKQIKIIPPRDRITLDYFDEFDGKYDKYFIEENENDHHYDEDDFNESYYGYYDDESKIQEEEDEINRGRMDNKSYGNGDDDEEFNPYEDDFEIPEYYDDSYDKFLDSLEENDEEELSDEELQETNIQHYNYKFINMYSYLIEKDIKLTPIEGDSFNQKLIDVHALLHNNFLHSQKTTLYSAVEKIFFYHEFKDSTDEIDKFINTFLSNEVKENINKLYIEVFKNNFDIISLGIYNILNKDDFEKLATIVNSLYTNGINTHNDYFVILGLKKLIELYNKDFINNKHILLEKLLNKYLINKKSKVYANSLIVKDLKGNFIPLNCLSTGERNLIILFVLALSNVDNLIILDEPDLSMSVEWQSKILVDLLNYTNNSYIVVTQSPLLIQKNTLSTYVKRMEFNDSIMVTPLIKMIKNIIQFNDEENSGISYDDISLRLPDDI